MPDARCNAIRHGLASPGRIRGAADEAVFSNAWRQLGAPTYPRFKYRTYPFAHPFFDGLAR